MYQHICTKQPIKMYVIVSNIKYIVYNHSVIWDRKRNKKIISLTFYDAHSWIGPF
jgi:hypothetical protein